MKEDKSTKRGETNAEYSGSIRKILHSRIPLSALAFTQYPHCRGTYTGDILQSTEKVDDFRGECDLRVWLCQISKNTYYDYLKKNKKYVPEAQNELSEDVFSTDFIQDFSDKETAFRVHKVLHKLSEPYKEVFSLRVFGELSFSDISDLFGKSESWARVTYHRACKKIREELDDEDHL